MTTPADANPSCDVTVNESGFYDCDLWGSVVTFRRYTPGTGALNINQISVWVGKNVCPKGLATMQTELSATYAAAEAQTPVPILTNTNRGTKYAQSEVASTNPFWRLDLRLNGVPIKNILVLGS